MSSALGRIVFSRLVSSFYKNYPGGMDFSRLEKRQNKKKLNDFVKTRLPNPHPQQVFVKKNLLLEVQQQLEELDFECLSMANQGTHDFARLAKLRRQVAALQAMVKEQYMRFL